MQCPVCTVDLVMAERQGVEIDYCPKCRGIWLDRGELDKIVERAAMAEGPGVPSYGPAARPAYGDDLRRDDMRRRDDDDDDDRYGRGTGRRRRGGWLGDILGGGDD